MSLLMVAASPAQEAASPIKISLVSDKTTYTVGEPVGIQVRVTNDSNGEIITHKGFMGKDFHLMITFTDPDGKPIRALYKGALEEPLAPLTIGGKFVVDAEIVPVGWKGNWVMDDARKWYGDFTKPGRYTARVVVPHQTFTSAFPGPGPGTLFANVEDSLGRFNPIPTDPIAFEIVPTEPVPVSSIFATVNLFKIGTGTRPNVIKKPLSGADVYLYKISSIPQDYQPIGHKTYQMIWDNLVPYRQTTSDKDGRAKFSSIVRDEYLILGNSYSSFSQRMAGTVSTNDSGWVSGTPIEKLLTIVEKTNGKKMPGRTTKITGSELLITEPEYVEWDSDAETYPFVFQSIGDWSVTTSVEPPKGFVADYKSLEADVTDEMETVQFTITDKGSSWTETQVTYTIQHKNKTQKIESKIGIKLSKNLAKEKGLGIYGDTGDPGTFEGGKKIDKDAKEEDKGKGKNKAK